MVRTLGGIVAGMAAALTIIMVTEGIGNQLAAGPPRLELAGLSDNPEPPLLTLLVPLLGWLLGAMIGGYIAIRISEQHWTAWVVAGLVLAAAGFNFVLMQYPVWVIVAGLIVPLLGAWLAQRICAISNRA
jgi:hypothetical protein